MGFETSASKGARQRAFTEAGADKPTGLLKKFDLCWRLFADFLFYRVG
jgi:hypothetical protein